MSDVNQELGVNLDGIFPNHSHAYTKPDVRVCEDLWTTSSSSAAIGTQNGTTRGAVLNTDVPNSVVGKKYRPPAYGVTFFRRIA